MNVRQLASRVDPGPAIRERPHQEPRRTGSQEQRASFQELLEHARRQKEVPPAHISGHAWQRIAQRGISMTEEQQFRLAQAMQQLEEKGAREALLLRGDAAFVVNVPNRTVVTAMDHNEMRHRIFTQIDSAMLIDS